MTRQMNAGANRRLSGARACSFRLSASLLFPLLSLSLSLSRSRSLWFARSRRAPPPGLCGLGGSDSGCGMWARRVSLDRRSEGFNDRI